MQNDMTRAEQRVQAAMRKQQLVDQAFDYNEKSTLWNVCRTAAEEYDNHAAEFRKVAEVLKNGGTVAMFADGKPGIRAAERMEAQFKKQAEDARKLMELFE